jgi:hypothetical protein
LLKSREKQFAVVPLAIHRGNSGRHEFEALGKADPLSPMYGGPPIHPAEENVAVLDSLLAEQDDLVVANIRNRLSSPILPLHASTVLVKPAGELKSS